MKILITGATGLIGTELVKQCLAANLSVHYLTTDKEKIETKPNYKGFYWNPSKGVIDIAAFEGVRIIVNLAGATISKRWTKAYKKTIINSRTKPAGLLYKTLAANDHSVTNFISASGVGIYPTSKTKLYTEEDNDIDSSFLSKVVVLWEQGAKDFKNLGIDVAIVRTGMVLAKDGGALSEIVKPIKLGMGSPLASGNQWQSWIHIEDIAGIYSYIIKNELEGLYNAVAPTPVQNKKLTKLVAEKLDKPLWLPNIPKFMLHLLLGEMAVLVTEGQLVSSTKIEESGYPFRYFNLENAIDNLL